MILQSLITEELVLFSLICPTIVIDIHIFLSSKPIKMALLLYKIQ